MDGGVRGRVEVQADAVVRLDVGDVVTRHSTDMREEAADIPFPP